MLNINTLKKEKEKLKETKIIIQIKNNRLIYVFYNRNILFFNLLSKKYFD